MKPLLAILSVIALFLAIDWANNNGLHTLVVTIFAIIALAVIIERITNAIRKTK